MSIKLPTRNEAGDLVEVTYYDAAESGAQLGGLAAKTVRKHTTGHVGDWPHLKLGRSPYMNAEHIVRVVEMLTHDPDRISEGERPARLGIACRDIDIEDIR